MNSSSKRLVVCGVTHQTANLEEREPLGINRDDLARANSLFASLSTVQEGLIVSTCNRVEFYFITGRDQEPLDSVTAFYQAFNELDLTPFRDLFKTKTATHAAQHLFRVVSGIDSMVLGETEIFGQLKEAYGSACAVKSAGKVIHRLFHQAFRAGKQVRTDTEMGKGACSVSTAAVELLREKFSTDERPSLLFIGVNKMIRLAATRCRRIHHSTYRFANRTVEKAETFATKFEGEAYSLDHLNELLVLTDVVITCTSSPEPIINAEMIDTAVLQRDGRRLTIMDLAIPRDVDYPKGVSPEIEVLDLEDIKAFVERQQKKRQKAIPQAEKIIEQRLKEFNYWWRHVKEESLYNGNGERIAAIVTDELDSVLAKCPPELRNELSLAARRIAERAARVGSGNTSG
ncbi:MAG: glutamyl-tRNA reductase [candidate division Zixibacteria bacterium]|nr:glutamyl-tRNA reductase [candidate division Zixibacteria bacterium]